MNMDRQPRFPDEEDPNYQDFSFVRKIGSTLVEKVSSFNDRLRRGLDSLSISMGVDIQYVRKPDDQDSQF